MAALVQRGTAVRVGFGSDVYTGITLTNVEHSYEADVKEIRDTDNAVQTVLISNPRRVVTWKGIIMTTTGSLEPPTNGATIVIGSYTLRVTASKVTEQAEEAVLEVTGVKETSMTYA